MEERRRLKEEIDQDKKNCSFSPMITERANRMARNTTPIYANTKKE